MARQVVHDDDVPGPKRRGEHLLGIGEEGIAVDGAVVDVGCDDPVVAYRGDQRRGLLMAVRLGGQEPLAVRAAAVEPRHVGLRSGLVEEE